MVTEAVFQLSSGSLKLLAPLNVSDISVIAIVFQVFNGLLKISAFAKMPEILVIVLTFQLFKIPLKEVQSLNIFFSEVTWAKFGESIASKFKFSQP